MQILLRSGSREKRRRLSTLYIVTLVGKNKIGRLFVCIYEILISFRGLEKSVYHREACLANIIERYHIMKMFFCFS